MICMEKAVDENDDSDTLAYSMYVKQMDTDHQPLNETVYAKEADISVTGQINHAPMSHHENLQ